MQHSFMYGNPGYLMPGMQVNMMNNGDIQNLHPASVPVYAHAAAGRSSTTSAAAPAHAAIPLATAVVRPSPRSPTSPSLRSSGPSGCSAIITRGRLQSMDESDDEGLLHLSTSPALGGLPSSSYGGPPIPPMPVLALADLGMAPGLEHAVLGQAAVEEVLQELSNSGTLLCSRSATGKLLKGAAKVKAQAKTTAALQGAAGDGVLTVACLLSPAGLASIGLGQGMSVTPDLVKALASRATPEGLVCLPPSASRPLPAGPAGPGRLLHGAGAGAGAGYGDAEGEAPGPGSPHTTGKLRSPSFLSHPGPVSHASDGMGGTSSSSSSTSPHHVPPSSPSLAMGAGRPRLGSTPSRAEAGMTSGVAGGTDAQDASTARPGKQGTQGTTHGSRTTLSKSQERQRAAVEAAIAQSLAASECTYTLGSRVKSAAQELSQLRATMRAQKRARGGSYMRRRGAGAGAGAGDEDQEDGEEDEEDEEDEDSEGMGQSGEEEEDEEERDSKRSGSTGLAAAKRARTTCASSAGPPLPQACRPAGPHPLVAWGLSTGAFVMDPHGELARAYSVQAVQDSGPHYTQWTSFRLKHEVLVFQGCPVPGGGGGGGGEEGRTKAGQDSAATQTWLLARLPGLDSDGFDTYCWLCATVDCAPGPSLPYGKGMPTSTSTSTAWSPGNGVQQGVGEVPARRSLPLAPYSLLSKLPMPPVPGVYAVTQDGTRVHITHGGVVPGQAVREAHEGLDWSDFAWTPWGVTIRGVGSFHLDSIRSLAHTPPQWEGHVYKVALLSMPLGTPSYMGLGGEQGQEGMSTTSTVTGGWSSPAFPALAGDWLPHAGAGGRGRADTLQQEQAGAGARAGAGTGHALPPSMLLSPSSKTLPHPPSSSSSHDPLYSLPHATPTHGALGAVGGGGHRMGSMRGHAHSQHGDAASDASSELSVVPEGTLGAGVL